MIYGRIPIMLKHLSIFVLFVLSIQSWSAVFAAPDGKALFSKHCTVCHGPTGEGGVGVPLALPAFINEVSDDYLYKTIRYGRPGRIMPSFNELSDAQVRAIVQFMRNWGNKQIGKENTDTVTGDASNGRRLYQKRCAQCHGDNGQGGKGTGVTFSRKRDLPIIAPALNNTGFLASATDSMIRSTIKSGRKGTPMTSQLVADLSEKEIDDIVSHIRSLKRVKPIDDGYDDESPVIAMDSPYDMDETIENLKQAIADKNFTLIRTEPLEKGFVKPGEESRKQMVLHFCNFSFLYEALSIDPRVGMFLPCRITVVEDKGKVKVMSINPLHLSKLFNNDELDTSCKEMYGIYKALIEDAIL